MQRHDPISVAIDALKKRMSGLLDHRCAHPAFGYQIEWRISEPAFVAPRALGQRASDSKGDVRSRCGKNDPAPQAAILKTSIRFNRHELTKRRVELSACTTFMPLDVAHEDAPLQLCRIQLSAKDFPAAALWKNAYESVLWPRAPSVSLSPRLRPIATSASPFRRRCAHQQGNPFGPRSLRQESPHDELIQ